MTHLTMDALLSLREAGQEPGDAAAREHLEGCEHCRAELERLHQRVARLKALPALRSGRDRWPEVRARVMAQRRHRRNRMAGLVGLAAAASIALAVAIGPDPGPPSSRIALGYSSVGVDTVGLLLRFGRPPREGTAVDRSRPS